MHVLSPAAATLLFACIFCFQIDRSNTAEVYVPKVPVKIAVKWKNWEKDGGAAAVKMAYKVIYAAALKCIGTKIEKKLKMLACHLVWSSASIMPSIPELIAKIGLDYAKCMPKAIGMQMAGAFGKMVTVTDNTAKLEDWGFSHVKQFIVEIGRQMPAVSRVPHIQKLPWLAPLLRFVWNLELKSEKEVPKPDDAEKAMEKAVEDTEKESPEMSLDERKTWLKSFSLANDALHKAKNKLMFPTLSLADFVLFSWYGMDYAEVTVCNWSWSIMLNSAQTWAVDVHLPGISAAADTAMNLLPRSFDEASASLIGFAQKQQQQHDEIQAALSGRNMTPNYWAYIQRLLKNGVARNLKPPDIGPPSLHDIIPELVDPKADKMLEHLTSYAVKAPVASLVERSFGWDTYKWMQSYESPTDQDIARAIDSAASYCWKGESGIGFDKADMFALMCENSSDGHLPSITREKALALVQHAMADTQACTFDKVSNYLRNDAIDHRLATATLSILQLTMERYLESKNVRLAEDKFLRYLLSKGLLFYQCVQLQTVHLIYDEGRREKYRKITPKARLRDIKKWKQGGGLLRRTIKAVCGSNFVAFDWEIDSDSKTAVNWANLKDKSEIARFLGLVLLARPSPEEPTAKDIPCLEYPDQKGRCYH